MQAHKLLQSLVVASLLYFALAAWLAPAAALIEFTYVA